MRHNTLIRTTFLILLCGHASGQGTWTQKADFGGGDRIGPVAFSIGSKGYMGLGVINSTAQNDFWEYDPSTNIWTQRANFAGGTRARTAGFSLFNKGYIVTGVDGSFSTYPNDCWEFNPILNSWTQKGNFPGAPRQSATGFTIGNYGYVISGIYNTTYYNDVWEYNPISDTWIQKANFLGGVRARATGFSIGNKGYFGLGDYTFTYNDFWEYNPNSDTWTQKAYYGGGQLTYAVGFSIGDKGYVGSGNPNSFTRTKIFFEFDTTLNQWAQKQDIGGASGPTRTGAGGFSIGNKGYVGTGYDSAMIFLKDFWEYTPDWVGIYEQQYSNSIIIYPNPFSTQTILQTDLPDGRQAILHNATLTVDNCFGQTVAQIKIINGQTVVLSRDNLPSGLYFIRLTQDNKIISADKPACRSGRLVITDK